MNNSQHMPQQDLNIKRPRAIRMVTIIALIVSAFVVIAAIIVLRWAATGRDVIKINNAPVPVRTIRPHPTADGVVILKIDYCKLTNTTGRVRTSFVSPSREVFLPMGEDKGPAKCEVREIPVLIPPDIQPGTYHVHFRATYETNPFRTVVEEFDSQPFEIVVNEQP